MPPPKLSQAELQDIARDLFSLEGELTALDSYADQNTLIRANEGPFVLKIFTQSEDETFLELQNDILIHIENVDGKLGVPRVLKSKKGNGVETVNIRGAKYSIRVVSYLEGKIFGGVSKSPELYENLGNFMGRLSRALTSFENSRIINSGGFWNMDNVHRIEHFCEDIEDPENKKMIQAIFENFNSNVFNKLEDLPKGVLHQDANENNLIVDPNHSEKVIGIIDFGDIAYSYRMRELAIALAYCFLGDGDILQHSKSLIKGYVHQFPLLECEIDLLFDIAMMRLVQSVLISTFQSKKYPDNDYILISQKPAFKALKILSSFDAHTLRSIARDAAGLNASS